MDAVTAGQAGARDAPTQPSLWGDAPSSDLSPSSLQQGPPLGHISPPLGFPSPPLGYPAPPSGDQTSPMIYLGPSPSGHMPPPSGRIPPHLAHLAPGVSDLWPVREQGGQPSLVELTTLHGGQVQGTMATLPAQPPIQDGIQVPSTSQRTMECLMGYLVWQLFSAVCFLFPLITPKNLQTLSSLPSNTPNELQLVSPLKITTPPALPKAPLNTPKTPASVAKTKPPPLAVAKTTPPPPVVAKTTSPPVTVPIQSAVYQTAPLVKPSRTLPPAVTLHIHSTTLIINASPSQHSKTTPPSQTSPLHSLLTTQPSSHPRRTPRPLSQTLLPAPSQTAPLCQTMPPSKLMRSVPLVDMCLLQESTLPQPQVPKMYAPGSQVLLNTDHLAKPGFYARRKDLRSRYVDALGGTASTTSLAALQHMFAPLAPMPMPLNTPLEDSHWHSDSCDALADEAEREREKRLVLPLLHTAQPGVRQSWFRRLFSRKEPIATIDEGLMV